MEDKHTMKNTSSPVYVGVQNDILYITSGRAPAANNDYPVHDANRQVLARVYDSLDGIKEGDGNAKLFAAAFNAFDSAASRLGIPAAELAEALQDGGIAELVESLKEYQKIIPAIRGCNELVALVIAENYGKSEAILAKIRKKGD